MQVDTWLEQILKIQKTFKKIPKNMGATSGNRGFTLSILINKNNSQDLS